MKTITKLWILIIILIALSPIGILAPEWLKAGAAWGEWGAAELKELVGYIPQGLEKLSELWKAPMPDYAFEGSGDKPLRVQSAAYILSAVIGIFAIVVIAYAAGKMFTRGEK
jgi:hypothetical protein